MLSVDNKVAYIDDRVVIDTSSLYHGISDRVKDVDDRGR
jgi:hypothetical protein